MEDKKFTSYMGIGLLILMAVSLIYFIAKGNSNKVSNYKIDNNTYFTGTIVNKKLEGKGKLVSPDGIYEGSFSNSRFDGPGSFSNDDYKYKANFNGESGNSNIKIELKDGKIYTKTEHGFIEDGKDEN